MAYQYSLKGVKSPTKETMQQIKSIFEAKGLKTLGNALS
mgnify:FL=1